MVKRVVEKSLAAQWLLQASKMVGTPRDIHPPEARSAMGRLLTRWRFFFIPALSGLLSWFCMHFEIVMNMRVTSTVAFAGIFFILAITIGSANRRRFEALDEIAHLKSLLLAFSEVFSHHLPKEKLPIVLDDFRNLFPTIRRVLDGKKKRVRGELLEQMDSFFHRLYNAIEACRKTGLSTPEIARLMHWYKEMFNSFERLLTIKENHTPLLLRYFIHWVLLMSILMLSPEFASIGWLGVVSAVLITLMIQILLNIQDMIEDPFGSDIDDIHFTFIDRIRERLTQKPPVSL